MPTYQYACTECDHAFEQVQKFSEDALTDCPQCTGRLRKIYNAVGVVFKGSGFYRNDSRSENKSAQPAKDSSSASGDSSASSSSESSSSSSSESSSTSGDSSASKSSEKKAPAQSNAS